MEAEARIVVDSNIFIAAALAIQSDRLHSPSFVLFSKVVTREIIAVASPQMLYELAGKLEKPDFGFTASFKLSFMRCPNLLTRYTQHSRSLVVTDCYCKTISNKRRSFRR
jgi:hypothetical protein